MSVDPTPHSIATETVPMLSVSPPNLFYAFGVPVISMAVSGLVCVALFKALGRIFRS